MLAEQCMQTTFSPRDVLLWMVHYRWGVNCHLSHMILFPSPYWMIRTFKTEEKRIVTSALSVWNVPMPKAFVISDHFRELNGVVWILVNNRKGDFMNISPWLRHLHVKTAAQSIALSCDYWEPPACRVSVPQMLHQFIKQKTLTSFPEKQLVFFMY